LKYDSLPRKTSKVRVRVVRRQNRKREIAIPLTAKKKRGTSRNTKKIMIDIKKEKEKGPKGS
jgi:hypothetical protein